MLRVIFLGAGVQVDLRTDAQAGQPDLFNTECEGMWCLIKH
jgi:hypothetical protein